MKARNRPASPVQEPEPGLFPIVGIGASAGGLEAVSELLQNLPSDTGMGFILVQHLDPKHSSELRNILSRITTIPVADVIDGTVVSPNHVYVIPPNSDMTIRGGVLRLSPRSLTRGQHLPVDHFLRSLAEDRGALAMSVILSGTASDGTEGSRAIKAAGGITFAQDANSAKYSSMPLSAVGAGCVDFVEAPATIAKELARIGQHPFLSSPPSASAEPAIASENQLEILLALVYDATGVDFTYYKQTTLERRIKRRILLHRLDSLKQYLAFVRNTPGEIEQLYQDILIHVTGFFRDPDTFEALHKQVFPFLFAENRKNETIRVWVPGCSSGEEVYSLAMAMLEYIWLRTQRTARVTPGTVPFQIFATDISDGSLDRARSGLYSGSSIGEISPERLKRFFVEVENGYQINKSLRDMCIFARQNVAKDPPFSNVDLISCRNLLIYLGPVLQRRVLPTLHYALRPNGYLMLGGAESLGIFAEHFAPVNKKCRIYQKKKSSIAPAVSFAAEYQLGRRPGTTVAREPQGPSSIETNADKILFNRYIPPSIVINESMQILQFRGKTGAYLEQPAGQPTFSLTRMARAGLLVGIRSALSQAKKENAPVTKAGLTVQSDGGAREIGIEVIPIRQPGSQERFYIVVFREDQDSGAAKRSGKNGNTQTKSSKTSRVSSRNTDRLQSELAQAREEFQTVTQDHETLTEEYKAANEEILSANEELQSSNEEMETSREELQSSNEELITLNEELQNRNGELSTANSDLLNLFDNVSIAVVMVGRDLQIRRFTPPAQKLLNLLPTDLGRQLSDLRPNLDVQDLGVLAREAIESVSSMELAVRDRQGTRFQMHVRPYKTWDGRIDGAVISFQDIDTILMKHRLDLAQLFAQELIETAREAILILDGNLRVVNANIAFYRIFEVKRAETEGRAIYDLGDGQWNIPALRVLLEKILPGNTRVEDFQARHDFPNLGERIMLLNARRIDPQSGEQLILLYIEDVTGKMSPKNM
jgi:two-component system CheB/CheR fusion protein